MTPTRPEIAAVRRARTLPPVKPATSPFGSWLLGPGWDLAHYFLPGQPRCLCGTRKPHHDAKPATCNHTHGSKHPGLVYAPFCTACLAINTDRWADRDGRITAKKERP
jgi:hypothetical protein